MRRRILEDSKVNEGGIGSKATPMSVVFANKNDDSLTIVEGDKWSLESHPEEIFEPIGIVVIPGEHGVLKDGTGTVNQCGVISLVEMRADNPTSGGSAQTIFWGQSSNSVSNKTDGLGRYDSIYNGSIDYDRCVTVNKSDQTKPTGVSSLPYIPCQRLVGGNATWSSSSYAPSPYADKTTMNSGGFNTAYSDTTQTTANCLSDFGGIVNTKILTDLATGQTNWRTASTITNTSSSTGSAYAPAACTCARYKTVGTKAFVDCSIEELRNGTGFWYMPAMGELGYIIPKLYDINNTIEVLIESYGVGVKIGTVNHYWSSNGYDYRYARNINANDGRVDYGIKGEDYRVRAFMRL